MSFAYFHVLHLPLHFHYSLSTKIMLVFATSVIVHVYSTPECRSDSTAITEFNCTNCGNDKQGFGNSVLSRWSNAQVFARHDTVFSGSTKTECAELPGNKYNFNNRLAGDCAWNNMPASPGTSIDAIEVASFVHTTIDPVNRVIYATVPSTRTIWIMSIERGNTSAFRVTGGTDMGPFDSAGAWIDGPRNVADFKRLGGLLYSSHAHCLLVWDVDRIRRVDLSSDSWGTVSLLCGVIQRYELLSSQHKLNIETKYFDFKGYRAGQPAQAGGLCDIDSTQISTDETTDTTTGSGTILFPVTPEPSGLIPVTDTKISLYNHLYEFLRRYAFFYNTNIPWGYGNLEVSGFAESGDGKIYFMLNSQPHVWRLVNSMGVGNGWMAGLIIGDVPCYRDRYQNWPIYPWPTVDDKLWNLMAVEKNIRNGWSNERCYEYDSVLICKCYGDSPRFFPDSFGTVLTIAYDLMFMATQMSLVTVNLKHPSLDYGRVIIHHNNLPWWGNRLIAIFQNNLAVIVPSQSTELHIYEYVVDHIIKSISFERSYSWTALLNQQPASIPLRVSLDRSYRITAVIGAEDFFYFVQKSTVRGTSQIFRVKLNECWRCEHVIHADYSGIQSMCDNLNGFLKHTWVDSNPYLGTGSFSKPSWGSFCCSDVTCSDSVFTTCDTESPAVPCFFESVYAIESKGDCFCSRAGCFPTSCVNGQEQSVPFKPLPCFWCPAGKYSDVQDTDFIRENGAKCRVCPVGKFSTEGSSMCFDCDAGKYNDSPGASKCFDCVVPLVRETKISGPCHECPLGSLYVNNPTACFFCPPGKYSDNRVSCETCLQITYSDEYGLSKCKLCQGSYGSTAGSESTEDRTQCRKCAPGKYNPSWGYPHPGGDLYGDGSYVPPHLNSGCQYCPAAYQASSSQSRCVFCPEGKVNPFDNVGICKSCNWNETHNILRESCIPCENGVNRNYMQDVMNYTVYSIDEASIMPLTNSVYEVPYQGTGFPTGCVQCRAGYDARQTTNGIECLPCAIGKYHPPPVTKIGEFKYEYSNVYKCESCPAHEYNNEIGGIICWECGWEMFRDLTAPVQDQTSCTKCVRGKRYSSYYSLDPSTHLGGVEKCLSCAAGTYAPYQAQCWLCPGGKYTDVVGSFACNNCAYGKVAGSGGTRCTTCAGILDTDALTLTSIPNTGSTKCIGCPKGMTTWYRDTTPTPSFGCSFCPIGSYAPFDDNQQCLTCESGKFSPVTGQTECMNCTYPSVRINAFLCACGFGRYQIENGIYPETCHNCPLGKYNDIAESYSCRNCEYGKVALLTGVKHCSFCDETPDMDLLTPTLIPSSDAAKCRGCPRGMAPWFQKSSSNASFGCNPCIVGTYSPLDTNTKCLLCEPGKFSPIIGQAGCIQCNPGSISAMGRESCDKCPAGKYESNNLCLNCPPHSTNFFPGGVDCICMPGYFRSPYGCSLCNAPYFKSIYGNSQCIRCESPSVWFNSHTCSCGVGSYLSATESTYSCEKCPGTTTTANIQAMSIYDCVCGIGYFQVGIGNCFACPYASTTAQMNSLNVSMCTVCKHSLMILRNSFQDYDVECGGDDMSPCVCPEGFVRKFDKCLECPLCKCGTATPESNAKEFGLPGTETTSGVVKNYGRVVYGVQLSCFLTFLLILLDFF